jgi:hypothetical protein
MTPCQRCGIRPAVATVRAAVRGMPPGEIQLCEVCLREGQLAARGMGSGLFDQFLSSLYGGRPGQSGPPAPGSSPIRQVDITQFFSDATRSVMRRAGELAAERASSEVDDDDLLGGVIEDDGVGRLLGRLGVDPGQLASSSPSTVARPRPVRRRSPPRCRRPPSARCCARSKPRAQRTAPTLARSTCCS